MITNKRYFVIFLDNYTHDEYKATKKQKVMFQLNKKKLKESKTRLMN